MNKVKITLISLFTLFVAVIVYLPQHSFAQNSPSIAISPSQATLEIGESETLQIKVVNPTTGMNAADIKITTSSNAITITNFAPTNGLLTIGECAENKVAFDAKQICLSIAKLDDFIHNEILGTFVIKGTADGEVMMKTTGTQLTDGKQAIPTAESWGPFTVESAKAIAANDSKTKDSTTDLLANQESIAIVGAIVLVAAVVLFVLFKRKKKPIKINDAPPPSTTAPQPGGENTQNTTQTPSQTNL